MKTIVFTVVALAATAWSAVVQKQGLHLPQYFETCQRDQPDVDSCLLNSLKNLLPYLVNGVPELDLPPLDPLVTEEILLGYANGHIEGKAIIKDYTTRGLGNLEFLSVKSNFEDLDNFELEIKSFIPKTVGDGKYKLQGRFLTSEFGGRGLHNITLGNITMTWTLTGSQQVIDGIRFMRIKHFDMEPEVGDMKVYFSNLFNGNEALSKSVGKLFNQYWRVIYKELLPYSKEGSDKILRDIANRVFLRVPFDEIFPVSSQ